MKYKAIWAYIKDEIECHNGNDNVVIPKEILKVCVEALEKQIPKEPNYQYDGYADGEPVWDIWECSSCGAEFEIDYDRHKYCPECGQAIDWEVKE